MWSDAEDEVIGGDLTAGLAYLTPAQGAVVTPVAPLGLRNREAGTVGFTSSAAFGRKLERIAENSAVALAYHTRIHGFATGPMFVLLQGTASYDPAPGAALLERQLGEASRRFLGQRRGGPFWDRWLSAERRNRVLVEVRVERVISWPDARCAGASRVTGAPLGDGPPPDQAPPAGGREPRLDTVEAARRLAKLRHALLGYRGADGFPVIAPVGVGIGGDAGIVLSGPLPDGGRRAGLTSHSYEPQLVGLETRQHTGWLQDGLYAPHTEGGFRAPPNRTAQLLLAGWRARRTGLESGP